MRVALVNSNPAVSRLITLSLNKIGYEYVEVGDFESIENDFFDILILDSDIDVGEANLGQIASKILYLSSKSSPEFSGADKILPKPFLPTEFISIIESLSLNKDESATADDEPVKFDEMDDEYIKPFDESEFVDELGDDDMFKDELKEESLDLNDDSFKPIDEDLSGDTSKIATEDTDKLDAESKQSALDELPDDLTDSAQEQEDDEAVQMLLKEEELLADFNFDDTEAESLDELNLEPEKESIKELDMKLPDEVDVKYENEFEIKEDTDESDEEDAFAEIKHEIDEIDNLDSEFKTADFAGELKDDELSEFDDFSVQNDSSLESSNEELDEDLVQAYDEILLQDSQDELDEISQEELVENIDKEEELSANSQQDEILDIATDTDTKIGMHEDIDEISEDEMATALNENMSKKETLIEAKKPIESPQSVANELTTKISEHIASSLDAGSLKELLKGMNIKINITFEEK